MTSELKLDEGSDAVVVQGGIKATFNASGITVNLQGATITIDKKGTVAMQTAANDTAAKAKHEIGALESTGEHKGEIYGGIYPADNKPIWFSAAPRLMDHYAAAAWAQGHRGSLPTREQGDYLTTLKGKGGAFTEIFNRGSSFPAGYVWLAEPHSYYRDLAWCQRLSDGDQYYDSRYGGLPVLCVVR
jgi:hypothetical protein